MANRKRINRQTTISTTLHRKLKIEQLEQHFRCVTKPGHYAVFCGEKYQISFILTVKFEKVNFSVV